MINPFAPSKIHSTLEGINSNDVVIGATNKLGRLFNSLGVTIVDKPRLSTTLPYLDSSADASLIEGADSI